MAYMAEEYVEVNEEEPEEESAADDEEILIGDGPTGAGRGINQSFGRRGFDFRGAEAGVDGDAVDDEKMDRDQQLLQDACLPVSGPPMPPSDIAPKDADEYLRQVQWERINLPEVVDVDVTDLPAQKNRRKRQGGGLLQRIEDHAEFEDDDRHCSEEWAADAAKAFRALREHCEVARVAKAQCPVKATMAKWRERCAAGRPSTDLLAAHDFLSINRLVTVAVESFVQFQEESKGSQTVEPAEVPEVPSEEVPATAALGAEAAPVAIDLERLDALTEWMFVALAFLEVPLQDEIQFQLQRLRRSCHRLLAQVEALPAAASSAGGCRAKLLLVVVTRVFGQR